MWINLFEELKDLSIQQARYEGVVRAIQGYEATGIPLVAVEGASYGAANFGDDQGLYVFVPLIAKALGMNPGEAISFFFHAVVLGSMLAWVLGCLAWLPTWPRRIAGILGLFFGWYYLQPGIMRGIWEVYVMAPCAAFAVVPAFLAVEKHARTLWPKVFFFAAAGLVLGTFQLVRVHSATAVLLFVAVWRVTHRRPARETIVTMATMFVGFAVPALVLKGAIGTRDAFLVANVAGYQPPASSAHAFWHTVYLGFGFLANTRGIAWQDAVAMQKVASIDPTAVYLTARYEEILRNEVFTLVRRDTTFVLHTIFAKAGVLFFDVLLTANVGVLFARLGLDWRQTLPLVAAISFSVLPGLLSIPWLAYVSGLLAWGPILALMALDGLLERRAIQARV